MVVQCDGNEMTWWQWQMVVANYSSNNKWWDKAMVHVLICEEENI